MARDRGHRPKGHGAGLPERRPDVVGDRSTGHPKFCLRFLQRGFDVTNLPKDLQADFAVTLQQRASMTWLELHQAGRHGQGYEQVPATKFRAPIPPAFQDRDRFHVFRYSGKRPMAGVRVGEVFHIIWLERSFGELYDHG